MTDPDRPSAEKLELPVAMTIGVSKQVSCGQHPLAMENCFECKERATLYRLGLAHGAAKALREAAEFPMDEIPRQWLRDRADAIERDSNG